MRTTGISRPHRQSPPPSVPWEGGESEPEAPARANLALASASGSEPMNLVNLLIEKGAMRETDLPKVQEALRDAPNKPLHTVLMEKGFAKEEDVLPVLGQQFGMEIVDLTKVN